jgi:hypothetical protein
LVNSYDNFVATPHKAQTVYISESFDSAIMILDNPITDTTGAPLSGEKISPDNIYCPTALSCPDSLIGDGAFTIGYGMTGWAAPETHFGTQKSAIESGMLEARQRLFRAFGWGIKKLRSVPPRIWSKGFRQNCGAMIPGISSCGIGSSGSLIMIKNSESGKLEYIGINSGPMFEPTFCAAQALGFSGESETLKNYALDPIAFFDRVKEQESKYRAADRK